MKDKTIQFTKEELKYIEKMMDLNASVGISRLDSFSKIRSIGFSSKIEKETIERMEKDLNDAQKITNQIRDKIEKYLK